MSQSQKSREKKATKSRIKSCPIVQSLIFPSNFSQYFSAMMVKTNVKMYENPNKIQGRKRIQKHQVLANESNQNKF